MSSLKSALLSLECPLVKPSEDEDDVRKLLLEKSPHRQDVLQWIVAEIESSLAPKVRKDQVKTEVPTANDDDGLGVIAENEDEEDTTSPPSKLQLTEALAASVNVVVVSPPATKSLEKRISSLGVPKARELVSAELKSDSEHQGLWRLLFKLLKNAKASAAATAEEEEFPVQHYEDLVEAMSRVKPEPHKKLIPRDIEKEVREMARKVTAPSKGKMEGIISLLQEEVARTEISEEEARAKEPDVAAAFSVESFQKLVGDFDHFNAEYEGSYLRWIEKQEGGGMADVPTLGEDSGAALEALQMVRAHFKAASDIRADVLEIDEQRKKVEKRLME